MPEVKSKCLQNFPKYFKLILPICLSSLGFCFVRDLTLGGFLFNSFSHHREFLYQFSVTNVGAVCHSIECTDGYIFEVLNDWKNEPG